MFRLREASRSRFGTEGDGSRLEGSYWNIRFTMNRDRRVWDPRCRNRRVDADRECRETDPDADLWGPGEVPPTYYGRYG